MYNNKRRAGPLVDVFVANSSVCAVLHALRWEGKARVRFRRTWDLYLAALDDARPAT